MKNLDNRNTSLGLEVEGPTAMEVSAVLNSLTDHINRQGVNFYDLAKSLTERELVAIEAFLEGKHPNIMTDKDGQNTLTQLVLTGRSIKTISKSIADAMGVDLRTHSVSSEISLYSLGRMLLSTFIPSTPLDGAPLLGDALFFGLNFLNSSIKLSPDDVIKLTKVIEGRFPNDQAVLSLIAPPAQGKIQAGTLQTRGQRMDIHPMNNQYTPVEGFTEVVGGIINQLKQGKEEELLTKTSYYLFTQISKELSSKLGIHDSRGNISVLRAFVDKLEQLSYITSVLVSVANNTSIQRLDPNDGSPIFVRGVQSLKTLLSLGDQENFSPLYLAVLLGKRSFNKNHLTKEQVDHLHSVLDQIHLPQEHKAAIYGSYIVNKPKITPVKYSEELSKAVVCSRGVAALEHALKERKIVLPADISLNQLKDFWCQMLTVPAAELGGKFPTEFFDVIHDAARAMAEEEHGFYDSALSLLNALHALRVASLEEIEEDINSLNSIISRARDNARKILEEESPWILEVKELNQEQTKELEMLCKNPLYVLALATLPLRTSEMKEGSNGGVSAQSTELTQHVHLTPEVDLNVTIGPVEMVKLQDVIDESKVIKFIMDTLRADKVHDQLPKGCDQTYVIHEYLEKRPVSVQTVCRALGFIYSKENRMELAKEIEDTYHYFVTKPTKLAEAPDDELRLQIGKRLFTALAKWN
ncbi:hypothetical protein [Vibrio phage phiKT1028]|nr:hypothetical protein [Vibrio phage phiKT1028]